MVLHTCLEATLQAWCALPPCVQACGSVAVQQV
jgi:hypothetical protein